MYKPLALLLQSLCLMACSKSALEQQMGCNATVTTAFVMISTVSCHDTTQASCTGQSGVGQGAGGRAPAPVQWAFFAKGFQGWCEKADPSAWLANTQKACQQTQSGFKSKVRHSSRAQNLQAGHHVTNTTISGFCYGSHAV